MATRATPAKTKKAVKTVKATPAKPKTAKRPAKKQLPVARSKGTGAVGKNPARAAVAAEPATGAKPANKSKVDRSPKTHPEATSVTGFIAALADPQQRADSEAVIAMMRAATGCDPVMWGSSIVGFDRYHYRYDSGREGDMALVGFSPRKAQLVLYIMPGFAGYEALLAQLGRHSTGKSCLYVKRLADVDAGVLDRLIRDSVVEMRRRHPR